MSSSIDPYLQGKVAVITRIEYNISYTMRVDIFDTIEHAAEYIYENLKLNDLIEEYRDRFDEESKIQEDIISSYKEYNGYRLILDDYSFIMSEFNQYGFLETNLI